MNIYEKLKIAYDAVRKKTDFVPEVALVLGSGLGAFGERVKKVCEISYSDIEGFPVSTVAGHEGKFIFGYVGEVKCVVMQGRVHFYEGYDISDVVMPIRLMGMLGAKKLILTNAAGGINKDFGKGCLMLITGHISSLVPSVLRGPNIEEFGVRFPDMTEVYSKALRELAKKTAKENGVNLKEGVYIQTQGPNYETPEEINAYRMWGADAVGMSTACEAIAARHMGMEICGISCITNMAAGLNDAPLTHEEVKETADRVAGEFERLVEGLIMNIK